MGHAVSANNSTISTTGMDFGGPISYIMTKENICLVMDGNLFQMIVQTAAWIVFNRTLVHEFDTSPHQDPIQK